METAEAPLDTHNPLTKMRARQMVEEETRLGGKFIQESPKTFAEKGWGDWYNDHRVFFRLIAFAAGCYMGYRWYRSQNPSDFAPSWDSSDLH
jgi:hypothetical protein